MLRTNGRTEAGEAAVVPKTISPLAKTTIMILTLVAVFITCIFATGFIYTNQVNLTADGKTLEISTKADNVSLMLQEQNIEFGAYDKVKITDAAGKVVVSDGTALITDEAKIEVLRSHEITLQVDGTTQNYQSVAKTVQEFLQERQVTLDQDDLCSVGLNEAIKYNVTIKVTRVEYKEATRYQELPYQIVEQESYDLPKGQTQLLQPGFNGTEEQMWQERYEDGVLVEESLVSSNVVAEPVNQIIQVGKSEGSFINVNGTNYQYTSELSLRATAYTYTGNRTATGITPYRGLIAVDTSVIPFGTKLYIEGYGVAVAADRGGAIKGNRVDLFMESYSEACSWGVRDVKAYVLQ